MRFTKDELIKFENILKENGYRCINGHFKDETYGWWNSFEHINEIGYQIAFLVYDFTKFPNYDGDNQMRISNIFILNSNQFVDRVDMTISDDKMTFSEFEDFSNEFYKLIKKFFKTT